MEKRFNKIVYYIIVIIVTFFLEGCSKYFIANTAYRQTLPNNEGTVDLIFDENYTFTIIDSIKTWMESSCEQKGNWRIKNSKLYISTDFQRRMDDFIYPIGICDKDSIVVYTYSIKTQKPSDHFAVAHHNIIPDTVNCRLSVPCEKKTILEKYIGLSINECNGNPYIGDVRLQCGNIYKMYIMDCFMSVFDNFEFEIRKNKIIATETGWIFKKTITPVAPDSKSNDFNQNKNK